MGKERSRKKSSFGVIFWIAVILLIVIILLLNLPSIREVLDSTNFVDVVFEQRDQDGPADPTPQDEPTVGGDERDETESPRNDTDSVVLSDEQPDGQGSSGPEGADGNGTTGPADGAPSGENGGVSSDPEEIVVPPPEAEPTDGQEHSRTATLYFIRVTDDGRILAEAVRRTIRYSSGPLTATINALIAGPNTDDHNRGLLSLVPDGTVLLSARVAEGVAYLNFNEAFRFNTMGLEGYLAQMRQVVQTATEFSTVDRVQILINGQIADYLGGDGVYIGEPLRAADLRR